MKKIQDSFSLREIKTIMNYIGQHICEFEISITNSLVGLADIATEKNIIRMDLRELLQKANLFK